MSAREKLERMIRQREAWLDEKCPHYYDPEPDECICSQHADWSIERDALRKVLARLDKAECNEGCVGVEEYDRVLAEVERLRTLQKREADVYRKKVEENERLRAERDEALAAMSADTADVVLAKCVAEARTEAALAIYDNRPAGDLTMLGKRMAEALKGEVAGE